MAKQIILKDGTKANIGDYITNGSFVNKIINTGDNAVMIENTAVLTNSGKYIPSTNDWRVFSFSELMQDWELWGKEQT
jgi:hypothetical protein